MTRSQRQFAIVTKDLNRHCCSARPLAAWLLSLHARLSDVILMEFLCICFATHTHKHARPLTCSLRCFLKFILNYIHTNVKKLPRQNLHSMQACMCVWVCVYTLQHMNIENVWGASVLQLNFHYETHLVWKSFAAEWQTGSSLPRPAPCHAQRPVLKARGLHILISQMRTGTGI